MVGEVNKTELPLIACPEPTQKWSIERVKNLDNVSDTTPCRGRVAKGIDLAATGHVGFSSELDYSLRVTPACPAAAIASISASTSPSLTALSYMA